MARPRVKNPKWKAAGFASKSAFYRANPAHGKKRKRKSIKTKTPTGRAWMAGMPLEPLPTGAEKATEDMFREVEQPTVDEAANDSNPSLTVQIERHIHGRVPVSHIDDEAARSAVAASGMKNVPKILLEAVAQAVFIERSEQIKRDTDHAERDIAAAVRKALSDQMLAFGRRLLERVPESKPGVMVTFDLTREQVEVLMEGLSRISANPYL